MSEVDNKLRHLLDPWLAPQIDLSRIYRWSRFYSSGNRPQNALAHSISITFLGLRVTDAVAKCYPSLDQALIIGGLAIHDFGEAELRRDISWPDKSATHDADEYEAFVALLERSGGCHYDMKLRFLLQFALRGKGHHAHFGVEAQEALAYLASSCRVEARVFEAIEYLDHMLYIAEQIRGGGTLAEVFRGEIHTVIDVLGRAIAEVPGFDEVWTPELDAWARSLMPQVNAIG